MLKIRLSRTGKKRQPSYRIVVADVNFKRDGRVVERIGYYNPLVDPIDFKIAEDRALHWLSVGAKPTDAVERLLQKQGTYERLSRLHAGESLEALVSEYQGEDPAEKAVPVAEAEPVTEAVAEEGPAAEVEEVEELADEEVDEEPAETDEGAESDESEEAEA